MMMPPVWSVSYAALMFLMWWVMMIAMMLPSVASIILLYSTLIRRSNTLRIPLFFSRNFLGRLPRCLGIFQPAGNSATISSGIARLCVSDDDVTDEPDHWCRGLDCNWAISIHTCEGILPTALPKSTEISYRETPTRL